MAYILKEKPREGNLNLGNASVKYIEFGDIGKCNVVIQIPSLALYIEIFVVKKRR